MFQERMRAVLRKERDPIRGEIIQSMRIGITRHEIQAMIAAGSKSRLQAVVSRTVNICQVIDLAEEWVISGKRKNWISRVGIGLIAINDARQFYSVIANIGCVKNNLAGKRM